MIKMYNAEVLSKFPVVQHFPFGSLFSWDQYPNTNPATPSVHTANQPTQSISGTPTTRPLPQEGTRAPWAKPTSATGMPPTMAPWGNAKSGGGDSGPNRRGFGCTSGTIWAIGTTVEAMPLLEGVLIFSWYIQYHYYLHNSSRASTFPDLSESRVMFYRCKLERMEIAK